MKPKSLLLLITALLFASTLFCQDKKDTIYFDKDWPICERPDAEYYRICILNKDKTIFYKGDVEDHFINNKIEMIGHYNDNGVKIGGFIFHDANSVTLIKGQYTDNKMSGDWFFYDSLGRSTTEIACKK